MHTKNYDRRIWKKCVVAKHKHALNVHSLYHWTKVRCSCLCYLTYTQFLYKETSTRLQTRSFSISGLFTKHYPVPSTRSCVFLHYLRDMPHTHVNYICLCVVSKLLLLMLLQFCYYWYFWFWVNTDGAVSTVFVVVNVSGSSARSLFLSLTVYFVVKLLLFVLFLRT